MSYGQNQPAGLVPVNTTTSAIYNSQNREYWIKSGYPFSIFRGDLVYVSNDGFIHALAELVNVATWGIRPMLGVFNGCSYAQPVSQNPTDFASPARPYWPAGTIVTNSAFGAPASLIDDPAVVYTIQTNSVGLSWAQQEQVGAVGFPAGFQGNTTNGQSAMFLDGSTVPTDGTGAYAQNGNLKVIGFDPTVGNPIPLPGGGKSPFVNAYVIIQNHLNLQRAPGTPV